MQNGSQWAKIKVLAGLHSFSRLQEKTYSLAFSTFQRFLYSLVVAPLPSSKPAITALSASVITSLSLTFLPPLFTSEGPCDYTGPIHIIQNNLISIQILNLLTSAKSLSLYKATYSHVLRIAMQVDIFEGPLFCLTQCT